MDPLQPMYVRLRASTIAALKDAKAKSAHRTLAAYVEDVLRSHLKDDRRDGIDRLADAAKRIAR